MKAFRPLRIVAVALVVAATACSSSSDRKADDDETKKIRDTAELPLVPPEVTRNVDQWPLPGRDYENSRARATSAITAANVTQLEPAWTVKLPGSSAYGNASTTPVVVDGTVYVQDLQSNVRAIDLETGLLKWTHVNDAVNIGPTGVAVGYGRVYAAKNSDEIQALDIRTGEEQWSTKLTVTASDGISIQPTVVAGLVLAATVPISAGGIFTGGDRGVLWALDVRTGRKAWSFDTVLGADLWGDPRLNSGGGAWYPPAVDPDAGRVYWGTGNPAPFPGTREFPNGASRPGPNLYTNSALAIDLRRGTLNWYHQATPHDLFDHDLQLVARATTRDGDVVIATGKAGRVLVLDAESGELLRETQVGTHENDQLTELTGPTRVTPGAFGGVLTPPAVSDGVVYVASLDAPSEYRPDEQDITGAELGQMPGDVTAVDAATGTVRWATKIGGDPTGGCLVMGDLVFTATFQGTIYALDRATGAIVHTIAAPGGINGWPAATGDTIVWPVGIGDNPQLVAYRLRGGGSAASAA